MSLVTSLVHLTTMIPTIAQVVISDGTGDWDMMAVEGSWNNNGLTPAHHNAYTKVKVYGWATATVLSFQQPTLPLILYW